MNEKIFKVEYSDISKRWYITIIKTKVLPVNNKEIAEKIAELLNKDWKDNLKI